MNKYFVKFVVILLILLNGSYSVRVNAIIIKRLKVRQKQTVIAPNILLTTINNNAKTVLYWDNQPNSDLSYYNIYRDSVDSSKNEIVSWINIGKVFENEINYFIDNSSNPAKRVINYYIAAVDLCGREITNYRCSNTIKLTYRVNEQKETELKWNKYIGNNVQKYKILKGESLDKMLTIDSISGSDSTYLDINSSLNNFYQIEAVLDKKHYDSEGREIKILSNIQSRVISGINEHFDTNSIMYFRNNTNNVHVIFPYFNKDHFTSKLYDLTGKLQQSNGINEEEFDMPINKNNKGVYILYFESPNYKLSKLIVLK